MKRGTRMYVVMQGPRLLAVFDDPETAASAIEETCIMNGNKSSDFEIRPVPFDNEGSDLGPDYNGEYFIGTEPEPK